MMRLFIFTIVTLVSFSIKAQQDSLRKIQGSVNFDYSYISFIKPSFKNFGLKGVNTLGASVTGTSYLSVLRGKGNFTGKRIAEITIGFMSVLPTEVTVSNEAYKFKGYLVHLPLFLGRDLFLKQQNFDFIITTGIETGRFTLKSDSKNKFKNNVVRPSITGILSFYTKHHNFQLFGRYSEDTSSTYWEANKNNDAGIQSPNRLQFSSFVLGIKVGLKSN